MRKASNTQDLKLISRSVEETRQFGELLGGCLAAGDVVGLSGELGTGKTILIQGIAKGLGIDPRLVRSPTFVLLREYAGRVGLIHIDGYRLEGSPSIVWLDIEWMFSPKKITVIEWADRFSDCLPDDYLEIRLSHKRTNQRILHAIGHGPRSTHLVAELQKIRAPSESCHADMA